MPNTSLNPDSRRVDPDPLVIDQLVNLAATGLAGLIVKLSALVLQPWRDHNATYAAVRQALPVLEEQFRNLIQLVDHAASLTGSDTRRIIGGGMLLDLDAIRNYQELRDAIFNQLRTLDELSERLLSRIEDDAPAALGSQRDLPAEFRTQITFIDKRLREARVAAYAEGAFLEIRAALMAVDRMIAQLRHNVRRQ